MTHAKTHQLTKLNNKHDMNELNGVISTVILHQMNHQYTVMWSETVGLRTRLVWDQKKSVLVLYAVVLVLVLQVWYCVVKHGLLRSLS